MRAAVPSLVLAAPALLPARRAFLSRVFSASAPALSTSGPILPRARSGGNLQALPAALALGRGGGAKGGPGWEPPLSPLGAGPMLRRPRSAPAVGPTGAVAGRGDRGGAVHGGGGAPGEERSPARMERSGAAARRSSGPHISESG